MADLAQVKRRTERLHVFLLKDGLSYMDAMRFDAERPKKCAIDLVDLDFEAELYVFPESSNPPSWIKLLQQATGALDGLVNVHHSAILFVKIKNGCFAFPFGQGHHKLNETAYVRDFGKLVVVNMVKPESISTMSMQNFQAVAISTIEEATQATNLETFAANVEEDLLKMLAGVPEDSSFASAMAGADSLHMAASIRFADLGSVCKRLWKEYTSPAYKKHGYAWVDNLQLLKDRTVVEPLEQLLIAELKKRSNAVQLSAPDDVRQVGVGHYAYGRKREKQLPGDWLRIEDLYTTYDGDLNDLDVRKVKGWQVEAFDRDGAFITVRYVHSLLLWETQIKSDRYVMYNGKWYKASKSFVDILNTYLKKVSVKSKTLLAPPKYMDEDEYIKLYNKEKDYTSLHKSRFLIDGRNIEPCDLFDHAGRFVHVKCWTSSSTFSHLLLQGNTSAQVCARLGNFREHMTKALKLRMTNPDSLFGPGYSPSQLKVTYALLRYQRGDIPFFSKLNLFSTGRRIESLGFKVEYEMVRMAKPPATRSKKKKKV